MAISFSVKPPPAQSISKFAVASSNLVLIPLLPTKWVARRYTSLPFMDVQMWLNY
jgi:hypothetical protein